MNKATYDEVKKELTNDRAYAEKYRLPGEIKRCNNALHSLEDIWKSQNKDGTHAKNNS